MSVIKGIISKLEFLYFILLFSSLIGCTEKSEAEKLRQYYSSISANAQVTDSAVAQPAPTAQGAPVAPGPIPSTPGLSPSGGVAQIVTGTPRVNKDGFCGDGIINGTTEDCDQNAIQNTNCRDYLGIEGEVKCQPVTCLYDISDCLTPKADKVIGGLAETCKCHCSLTPCSGGCRLTGLNGQGACEFDCDNECICQCEGRLNATIEECKFLCICTVDANANPDCQCNLEECDILTTISQNIGTLVSTPHGIGGVHH